MIHLELIFLNGLRWGQGSFFQMENPVLPVLFIEDFPVPTGLLWQICQKSNNHISIYFKVLYFIPFIYLFVFMPETQCMITVASQKVLKSDNLSLLTLLIFFKIALDMLGPKF